MIGIQETCKILAYLGQWEHNNFNSCSISLALSSDADVLADVRKIVNDETYVPEDPREFCRRVFTTCYMASENSSQDTCNRAKLLAEQIGRYKLEKCWEEKPCSGKDFHLKLSSSKIGKIRKE